MGGQPSSAQTSNFDQNPNRVKGSGPKSQDDWATSAPKVYDGGSSPNSIR
jgi:hypothetical protein